MVGIGITVGALVMLTLFTWLNHLPRQSRARCPDPGLESPTRRRFERLPPWSHPSHGSAYPHRLRPARISASADDLRPKDSRASKRLRRDLGEIWMGGTRGAPVVITGRDEAEVGRPFRATRAALVADTTEIPREVLFPPSFLFAVPITRLPTGRRPRRPSPPGSLFSSKPSRSIAQRTSRPNMSRTSLPSPQPSSAPSRDSRTAGEHPSHSDLPIQPLGSRQRHLSLAAASLRPREHPAPGAQ